ncbi:WXG100 family type VII secretion target [Nocardia sp. NPDC052566]|uniref:WXG100 family type VII secretion target n=1 Tax=Nocardia sp. NPDC052566 TaxID=3364330 RepID=UPI0037CB725C
MADPALRAAADSIRSALAENTESGSGGTDPVYATEREHFDGYTHQEIWDRVHEVIDPEALGRAADAWRAGADAIGEAFQAFSDAADHEFARWSGRAADAARQATREFVDAGGAAHDVCRAVQRLMELNRDAAQAIRAAIPPPGQYRPADDPVVETVLGGQRRMDHDSAAAAAQADAQDTMTYVYTPTMPASGDRVPRFTPRTTDPAGGRS